MRTQLQSKRGQAKLAQLPLPQPLGTQRDELLSLLQTLDQKISTIERWLEKETAKDVAVQRLQTHPGIG
jgi:transposase